MREILFRGKRLDNGEWVEGAYCPKSCDSPFGPMIDKPSIIKLDDPFSGFWFDVDPSTVGQFTGLTDKDDKKIFEGDFLAIRNLYPHEVKYADGGFHMAGTAMLIKYANKYEVIGNKWDNPELLEGEG